MARTRVFVSYAHHDHVWMERLQVHLKPLERRGLIQLWDDTKIRPGAIWRDEIDHALADAGVAVFVVSADSEASDFIQANELPRLLAAAARNGVLVLSVVVGSCLFHLSPLAKYQAVNSPDRPLSHMPIGEAEGVLVKVVKRIFDHVGP